ncbi:SGNH/GDSL hydrolase family protein [Bacillaceae bacterium Marseille-Q3522]|nr:SGNH/GDSL hydrolase family protein [Bacillaceae bacterium Marseille-Q3522]
MRKAYIFLFLTFLILTACAQSAVSHSSLNKEKEFSQLQKDQIPVDFIPRDIKVVSVGDSLTEGIGDETKQGGYIPYLQSLMETEKGINKTDFANFGKKGNRTSQLLKRLETPELKQALQEADLIIVTIGGNDLMKVIRDHFTSLQLSVFDPYKEQYENDLNRVLETIRTENNAAGIVLVGLYNPIYRWFSTVTELNQVIADWNERSKEVLYQYTNTYFVDIADLFQTEENLVYTDFFHPNNHGYELIASRVFESLDKVTFSPEETE